MQSVISYNPDLPISSAGMNLRESIFSCYSELRIIRTHYDVIQTAADCWVDGETFGYRLLCEEKVDFKEFGAFYEDSLYHISLCGLFEGV